MRLQIQGIRGWGRCCLAGQTPKTSVGNGTFGGEQRGRDVRGGAQACASLCSRFAGCAKRHYSCEGKREWRRKSSCLLFKNTADTLKKNEFL